MIVDYQQKKGFFARNWGWLLAAALVAITATALLLLRGLIWGSAKIDTLNLSAESVVSGQIAEATVNVENTGLLPLKYKGSVLVDDKRTFLCDEVLNHGKQYSFTVDLPGLAPGSHTVSIGGLTKELKVLRPAELRASGLAVSPEKIVTGNELTVTARVSNTGEVAGKVSGVFSYDGAPIDTTEVSLGPGEEKTVSAKVSVQSGGKHTVSFMDQKCEFTALVAADVKLTDLRLVKSVVKPGETVLLQVMIENRGDLDGDYPLKITINGKTFQSKTVSVHGRGTLILPFTITQKKGGTYTIAAGGITQTLRVVVITRPKSGALLVKKANSGGCRLEIINNNNKYDVLYVLASASNPRVALLSVYVRAGEKASNIRVKDGTYCCFIAGGTRFDSISKRFLDSYGNWKDSGTLTFSTTRSRSRITYNGWSVTLFSGSGNSSMDTVNEDDFPQ